MFQKGSIKEIQKAFDLQVEQNQKHQAHIVSLKDINTQQKNSLTKSTFFFTSREEEKTQQINDLALQNRNLIGELTLLKNELAEKEKR